MQKENVLQLIDEKLAQLEEAEKAGIWEGKINFGVHFNMYKDSLYMPAFLKKTKTVNRLLLFEAFAIPVLVFTLSFGNWPEESIWKTVIKVLLNALFIGGIFIYGMLRSLVQEANSAQKEAKKLMLHDLRQKVESLHET